MISLLRNESDLIGANFQQEKLMEMKQAIQEYQQLMDKIEDKLTELSADSLLKVSPD